MPYDDGGVHTVGLHLVRLVVLQRAQQHGNHERQHHCDDNKDHEDTNRTSTAKPRFGPSGAAEYVDAYGRRGAITDDTQMALFTAEGLIRARARHWDRGLVTCRASSTGRTYGGYLPRRICS